MPKWSSKALLKNGWIDPSSSKEKNLIITGYINYIPITYQKDTISDTLPVIKDTWLYLHVHLSLKDTLSRCHCDCGRLSE